MHPVPCIIYLAATGQFRIAVGLRLFLAKVVHPIGNVLRPLLAGRDPQMHERPYFYRSAGRIGLSGVYGIIMGAIIAALFTTAWEMYGEVFNTSLTVIKENNRT
ncbi:MAG: AI-2E family transporter [Chlorobiaceae bacterium]|nr:AI-2E family transporter [Chlorobiaceae bacterium]